MCGILLKFCRQYIELLQLLKDLYQLGFVIISQEVNMVYGSSSDGFYHLLEVVFLKTENIQKLY